jgi:hypothetical protein
MPVGRHDESTAVFRWTTVLACDDPLPVAQFWATLLGSQIERITDDFFVVRHGSTWLAAHRSGSPTRRFGQWDLDRCKSTWTWR